MHDPRISDLWEEVFPATWVISVDERGSKVDKFLSTLPLRPDLLRIDSCKRGIDPDTGKPETNHHWIVGARHKRILREARRLGLNRVFVFEEDAEFVGDVQTLESVLQWIRSNEALWDVFYLGFSPPFPSSCLPVDTGIIQTFRPFQAHALCYSERMYDEFLAIDLTADHRPPYLRRLEAITTPIRRRDPYHRDGIGSIDSWLASSRLRRLSAFPLQFVQTSLPPGTERGWERFTFRAYDTYETPQEQVRLSLRVGQLKSALGVRFDRVVKGRIDG